MQLSSQQTLPTTVDNAWAALNNIDVLKACIPGCESLVETEPHRYEVVVMAAVGPVKARFKGKLTLVDLQPPQAYTIHFEGQGGAAGHGKGSAQVRLEAQGPAATVLHYSANASVGGKIAQIGQRLVDMAAQKMAGDFFESFNAQILLLYPAPAVPGESAAPPDATSPGPAAEGSAAAGGPNAGFLTRLRAWLRRFFGS
ncbi:MAG: carbon monoxide dehydrogenase [Polaromonas sp.]|nr:carbon monoxide dehydrogenase [Polaromonas sp.]